VQDAWALVERAQRERPEAGWIIPQPAHSALAGDIAVRLSPEHFPGLTKDILQAIALHDTGWSAFDAQQIESLRQQKDFRPTSFVAEKANVFLPAWTGSIDVAEKISAAAGHTVSRHFVTVGKEPDSAATPEAARAIEAFNAREKQRQARLAPMSGLTAERLEQLLQALRFCDLLSLFLCSNIELERGAAAHFKQNATHPAGYALTRETDAWVFRNDSEFASPLREAAELTFSGVAFGAGAKGGSWFNVRLQ
jgi:hypothetical protein